MNESPLEPELLELEAQLLGQRAQATAPQLRARVLLAVERAQRAERRVWLSSVAAMLLALLLLRGSAHDKSAPHSAAERADFAALGLSPAESKHWSLIAQRAELPMWAPLVDQSGAVR